MNRRYSIVAGENSCCPVRQKCQLTQSVLTSPFAQSCISITVADDVRQDVDAPAYVQVVKWNEAREDGTWFGKY